MSRRAKIHYAVMDAPTTPKMITVFPRGDNLARVTEATRKAWHNTYFYTLNQVWTWRGGEAVIGTNYAANYGRGESRAVVRTGGLTRGKITVLYASSFSHAMQLLGITFRIATCLRGPRRPRTRKEQMRATLATHARREGNTFRTLRARPRRGARLTETGAAA